MERDAAPLLGEALRVLALKAAVFELCGGDEHAAELLVPAPVDEMIHAVLAQFTLMTHLQRDLGVTFPMLPSWRSSPIPAAASPTPTTPPPGGESNRCGTGWTRPR